MSEPVDRPPRSARFEEEMSRLRNDADLRAFLKAYHLSEYREILGPLIARGLPTAVSAGDVGPTRQTVEEPVILVNARSLAQRRHQTFDTVHIVSMPLLEPTAAGAAGAVMVASITVSQRDQWLQLLDGAARVAPPPVFPGGPTARLMECERRWQEAAMGYEGGVSDLLVLHTVLSTDLYFSETMHACGIDANGLLRNLETQLNAPNAGWGGQPNAGWGAPAGISGWGATPNPGQGPNDRSGGQLTEPPRLMAPVLSAEDQAAMREAMRLIKRVPIRPGLLYTRMFPADMLQFLDILSDSALNTSFVVLSGMNGSPATRFGEILAGRIATGERFDGHQAMLANCHDVVMFDMRTLNSMALSGGLDPTRVLAMGLEAVAAAHAILMVEHMEVINNNQSPAPELRNVLVRRGAAIAFGLYRTVDNADPHLERSLGMSTVVPIHTRASTPQETGTLINQVYAPYWAGQYRVAVAPEIPGVFADIYALEPGIHINRQRMTLPFVAVDMAEDAIQLATRGGEQAIAETVQGALAEIARLRGDRQVPDAIKMRFERALIDCEREIRSLSRPPRLHIDQSGLLKLTRAHITAQLIDVNDSYFAYPSEV